MSPAWLVDSLPLKPLGKPVFLCLEEDITIIIIVFIILATLHAYGILVPQAGIEPRPSMESQPLEEGEIIKFSPLPATASQGKCPVPP